MTINLLGGVVHLKRIEKYGSNKERTKKKWEKKNPIASSSGPLHNQFIWPLSPIIRVEKDTIQIFANIGIIMAKQDCISSCLLLYSFHFFELVSNNSYFHLKEKLEIGIVYCLSICNVSFVFSRSVLLSSRSVKRNRIYLNGFIKKKNSYWSNGFMQSYRKKKSRHSLHTTIMRYLIWNFSLL